jgi:uncharacterized membrane protein (DUF106 family)
MTDVLAHVVAALNTGANAVGSVVLAPVGFLPGWLSATLIAVITGVLLLVVFKYTSNQRAIKRVRDDINAHLLALKLFKDSAAVAVQAQGRVLLGGVRLFLLALVPMAVMALPVALILGQMSLWYQQRPLRVGEEAVVTMKLGGEAGSPMPPIRLEPTSAVDETETVGPVRIPSKREAVWKLQVQEKGQHRLAFVVGDQTVEKELAVGDGFMRVSSQRPGWVWSDALLYPAEEPLAAGDAVQSIEIVYPPRPSWISGSTSILGAPGWMIYWFLVSLVAAFCFRRVLNVQV